MLPSTDKYMYAICVKKFAVILILLNQIFAMFHKIVVTVNISRYTALRLELILTFEK